MCDFQTVFASPVPTIVPPSTVQLLDPIDHHALGRQEEGLDDGTHALLQPLRCNGPNTPRLTSRDGATGKQQNYQWNDAEVWIRFRESSQWDGHSVIRAPWSNRIIKGKRRGFRSRLLSLRSDSDWRVARVEPWWLRQERRPLVFQTAHPPQSPCPRTTSAPPYPATHLERNV